MSGCDGRAGGHGAVRWPAMSSPMQHPINRKKYGQPRWAIFYANRARFAQPGLHLWTGKRDVRILPLPPRGQR